MTRNSLQQVRELEVIADPFSLPESGSPPVVVVLPSSGGERRGAFFSGVAIALALGASGMLGWQLTQAQREQERLRQEVLQAESLRAEERQSSEQTLLQLQRGLAERDELIAQLELERMDLAEAATANEKGSLRPAPRIKFGEKRPEPKTPNEVAASPVPETLPGSQSAVDSGTVAAGSPLAHAVEATSKLSATRIAEPPTLGTIEEHIQQGDPAVASNRDAVKAEKSGLTKLLTNRIFIDSVVLGGSLLVPPSLPLTLAQSRLGRSLTNRVMKKTDLDKTVAGKVAQDVGNMPITQKKKKK